MKLCRLSFFDFRTAVRNSAEEKIYLLLYLNLYEFVIVILIFCDIILFVD